MKYADYLRVLNEHIQAYPLKLGNLLGFSLQEIPECAIMRQFLGDDV